jgi:hypothetical protein
MSYSLSHVIHTDSTQYKQLQNKILSITSDHENVWVYICVLSKLNIWYTDQVCSCSFLWKGNILIPNISGEWQQAPANRLPGAYFFSLHKGVVLKTCTNAFFLFKVEMLKLSIKISFICWIQTRNFRGDMHWLHR